MRVQSNESKDIITYNILPKIKARSNSGGAFSQSMKRLDRAFKLMRDLYRACFINDLHWSSWSIVSCPVARMIRFIKKELCLMIPKARVWRNSSGLFRKHCKAWNKVILKNVKKMFAKRYPVFQSKTNSSHLLWLLKRITLMASRKKILGSQSSMREITYTGRYP